MADEQNTDAKSPINRTRNQQMASPENPDSRDEAAQKQLEQRRVTKAIRRARAKAEQRADVERKHERKAAREAFLEKRRQERLRGSGIGTGTDDNGTGAAGTPSATAGVTGMFEYGYRKHDYGPDELVTDAHGNPITVAQAMLTSRQAAQTKTSTPHLAFYSPRIPGNTGSAIRLCAVTGTILHLIEPLGFNLKDTKLRRAGLDYHDMAHVVIHPDFDEMADSMPQSRIIAFTAHATKMYTDIDYRPDDILLFGPEPGDIPDPLDIMFGPRVAEQVRLPMRPSMRSLNLTNTASIAIYEAWRQLGFQGGK